MEATARRTSGIALALVMVLGACGNDPDGGPSADTACVDDGDPFEGETQLFIEYNDTDQDTGLQGLVGSEGVSSLCLRKPDGTEMMLVDTVAQFEDLGVGDFFFESREPPADEYSIDDLEADFPEGEYRISGVTPKGDPLVGTADFTHDIPAAPVIAGPELAEEDSAGDVVLPTTGLTVRWEPATETLDGRPLTVTAYEVIVTQVEHEDPHGQSRPVYDVHVPADQTELPVVDGFLRPGTVYELELLVLEESGNQTISLGFFTTAS
jgi:hypothetical protein